MSKKKKYYEWDKTINKDNHYDITIGEKGKGKTFALLQMRTALEQIINGHKTMLGGKV